jgi:hypothetical protein
LVSIWVNVGHAEHCVMNDQIDVIEKLANALYELNFISSILIRFLFLNRIAKEIAKVIDVNDVVPVMFSMHELINAYPQIHINHMDRVQAVEFMLINNLLMDVVQHQ